MNLWERLHELTRRYRKEQNEFRAGLKYARHNAYQGSYKGGLLTLERLRQLVASNPELQTTEGKK